MSVSRTSLAGDLAPIVKGEHLVFAEVAHRTVNFRIDAAFALAMSGKGMRAMSDATPDYTAIPVLGGAVREVHGTLPDEAALQQATASLLMAGFDRGDLSIPTAPGEATTSPTQATDTPADNNDTRNVRANINGTLGATGALIAGTVASVATGGAMLPVAAAAIAAGVGAGGLSHLGFQAAADSREAGHDARGAKGTLMLAAIVQDAEKEKLAMKILREAGATDVAAVERT